MNDTGGRNRSMHRVHHLLSVYSFFPSTSLQKRQPAFGPHTQCPLGLITFPLSSLLFISYLFFVLPALSGSSQSYLQNATKIISFLQPSCSPRFLRLLLLLYSLCHYSNMDSSLAETLPPTPRSQRAPINRPLD